MYPRFSLAYHYNVFHNGVTFSDSSHPPHLYPLRRGQSKGRDYFQNHHQLLSLQTHNLPPSLPYNKGGGDLRSLANTRKSVRRNEDWDSEISSRLGTDHKSAGDLPPAQFHLLMPDCHFVLVVAISTRIQIPILNSR